ncbi:MAG: gfo/Idh/MocA family oxidoreductase [Calditrichaeota bacterium]|nr:Gfo/Idh/MocA family oxidoreductase [Calditrichota bacterium]RQW01722.1 MAG: gfo/Idh/MocA family oxidoreductase [Calditrichota bacterium]
MNSEKIKIGVIGVGHLGRWHVQQLKLIPGAELVGFFDSDPLKSTAVQKEFNIKSFSHHAELLEQIDAVSIVTPTTTHFDYAQEAVRAGKHVFIEKPVTETVEQGQKLVEAAEASGVKIQVGHIERFNPAILALEDITLNPLFIESHRMANFNPRGTDVAVVLDLMIHDIDLILSFVRSPVQSIDASGVSILSLKEDIANCRINFENGAVANVTASRISARKMRKMRFFQPNAYISVDFLEGTSEVYELVDPSSAPSAKNLAISFGTIGQGSNSREIRYTRYDKKDINPLHYELSLFINAIRENTRPPVDGEQGVRALKVAKQILEKIEEHAETVKKHWDFNSGS